MDLTCLKEDLDLNISHDRRRFGKCSIFLEQCWTKSTKNQYFKKYSSPEGQENDILFESEYKYG